MDSLEYQILVNQAFELMLSKISTDGKFDQYQHNFQNQFAAKRENGDMYVWIQQKVPSESNDFLTSAGVSPITMTKFDTHQRQEFYLGDFAIFQGKDEGVSYVAYNLTHLIYFPRRSSIERDEYVLEVSFSGGYCDNGTTKIDYSNTNHKGILIGKLDQFRNEVKDKMPNFFNIDWRDEYLTSMIPGPEFK